MLRTPDQVIAYLRRFTGAPYRWGGNGPEFDCSGLACEGLKYAGILSHGDDLVAQDLYRRFAASETAPLPGALVFFGARLTSITHVGIVVDETHMIEAGGGDAKTTDIHNAVLRGAMVRERPFRSRKDLLGFYMPPYARQA